MALLALFKWRRPEARLIVFLSLVPQTNLWYEVVPLLVIGATLRQSVLLAASTSLPIALRILAAEPGATIPVYPQGFELALFAYLPAIALVLMRPNIRESDEAERSNSLGGRG